jgi:hypothetical protein
MIRAAGGRVDQVSQFNNHKFVEVQISETIREVFL